MNKKGFTLTEILVVIALISMLTAIVVPSVIFANKKIKEKSYNTKMELVLASAKQFTKDNKANLFENSNCVLITVKDLVDNGYYEEDGDDVIDPRTNETLLYEKIVLLKVDNSYITKKYDDEYKNCEIYY